MELPITDQAKNFLDQGLKYKADGNFDAALGQFRRAIVLDPQLFQAHMEIGLICKARSEAEPFLQRHAFEAFRHAARLNLNHQAAHDEYILFAQKMGTLDELYKEYDTWLMHYPNNEQLRRCKKNLITISMAMMPDKVNVASGGNAFLRKSVMFISLGMILLGLILIFVPPLLKKGPAQSAMTGVVKLGLILCGGGIAGFVFRSRIQP